MRGAVTFVFGSGWWVLWHFFLLVWLLPLGWLLSYFHGFQPGKGPQGGEVVLALLLFVLAIWMAASLVNALLWAGTLAEPGWGKYLKAAGGWLAGWIALLVLIFFLVERATSTTASAAGRLAGVFGLGLAFAALYGLNLFALWRCHAGRG